MNCSGFSAAINHHIPGEKIMNLMLKALSITVSTIVALGFATQVHAAGDVIKIGYMSDMSGPYSDSEGNGGAEAIRMAIADAGGSINGKKIVLLTFDHQNKADNAASKTREWIDREGVDLLISGANSATNLAMAKIAWEKKKVFMSNAGTSRLSNEECSPYTIHYAYDTVALAKGTGSAVVKQGGKSWFFLTADYSFGESLERDTSAVVKANGGTVVGSVRHPVGAADFSSFILQAQASKAQVLAFANGGTDVVNSVKASNEFGVNKTMKLVGLLMFIHDIHSMGLKLTQGMYLTDSWYWDLNDESRKFGRRYFEKVKEMPSSLQAADYSGVSQYLKAVKETNTLDADTVLAKLHATKFNDMYLKNGYIRPDGRMVHDVYLFQVKTPAESKAPWDYLKVAQVVPGGEAFTTKAESKCPLWK
jgi:branched-chain amino acid transport system substrate-binding protein